MGTSEKCPKCKSRLRFSKASYERANATNGVRCSLPDSYSCIICGYYREEFKHEETPEEFKKDFVRKEYPQHRKSLGEVGWLKDLIHEHYDVINSLRDKGFTWRQVHIAIAAFDPLFSKAEKTSICTGFSRELAQRGGVKRERIRGLEVSA
jgi:hypothetical protein